MSAAVYRMYDAGDDLLYVGSTTRWPTRIRQHARLKPWWGEVVSVRAVHFDTVADALRAERAAQDAESPRYNLTRAKDPDRPPCGYVKIATHVPAALARDLHALAARSERSLAAEIRVALRSWIEHA